MRNLRFSGANVVAVRQKQNWRVTHRILSTPKLPWAALTTVRFQIRSC